MTPSDSTSRLTHVLQPLVETFDQFRVRYSLIGGLAVGFRSRARFTEDIDLLLDVPQLVLPRVLDRLQSLGFEFNHQTVIRDLTQSGMTQIRRGDVPVDWLKPVLPCIGRGLERAPAETWGELTIRVATCEDLIVLKLLALRAQDVVDIQNLLGANRGRLDLNTVRTEIAATLTDDSVLERFEDLVRDFYRPDA